MEPRLSEIARFLALRPPFEALAPEELGEVVADTQLEFHPAGDVILSEDGGPVTFLRVIHSGAVDIVHDGQLLDILGVGDTFGHGAMLSGLPPGFEARAAEDTLCYRIGAGSRVRCSTAPATESSESACRSPRTSRWSRCCARPPSGSSR